MRRTIIVCAVVSVFCGFTYGGVGTDSGKDITQTTDGNLVVAASSEMFGMGVVFKIDPVTGAIIWSVARENINASTVVATDDGGCVVAGSGWDRDAYIAKLNIDGETEWFNTFTSDAVEKIDALCSAPDGGYYATGNYGVAHYAAVAKFTDNGRVEWVWNYDERPGAIMRRVITTNDGCMAVGKMDDGVYVVRLNSMGEVVWTRNYHDELGRSSGSSVAQVDGGFVVVGGVDNNGWSDGLVMRIAGDGDIVWWQGYDDGWGGSDGLGDVTVDGDELVAVGAFWFLYGKIYHGKRIASKQAVIMRVSAADGSVIDMEVRGEMRGQDQWNRIIPLAGGGHAVCGYTTFNTDERIDVWVEVIE